MDNREDAATVGPIMRTILDGALDAVVVADRTGLIVEWNEQADKTFGWTRGEAVGQKIGDLIVPLDQREAYSLAFESYEFGQPSRIVGQRIELSAMRRDGMVITIELRTVAVGHLFCGFARDVSGRSEHVQSSARMAALVNSSFDAIIGKDVNGTINSWNQGAELVYGYSETEAIGETIDIILPEGQGQEEPEIQAAVQNGSRLTQFQTVRRRKNGEQIHISLTQSPIFDQDDTLIGTSTIERDITESERQKNELRNAKEAAEEAMRLRAEFLANVSHELRTPMNAIIGMTQIALDEDLDTEIRDYIETANTAAHSLLTLLNDILDFSKIESGTFTIESDSFHIHEMLDETVRTLSGRAFDKGIELAFEIGPSVPEVVRGDSNRLRQVLTNLVANAIKFTDQGEVILSVTVEREWPTETSLKFSIRDTGIGIAKEYQQRIIEPFRQVDASSTRRHGGTGLGLSICNELLTLMGSRLEIESELNVGSQFSFRITLPRRSDVTAARSPQTIEGLRDMPVLVVDDNEANRRIISRTLANWSLVPDAVANADQALAKLENASDFPLVIVDAMMPGIDGFELSSKIGERLSDPPPVIMMLSTSDRRALPQISNPDVVAAYVQKPVGQSDLLDAIMRAVQIESSEVTEHSSSVQVSPSLALNVLLVEDTPANQKVVSTVLTKRGHSVTIAQNGREALELFQGEQFDVILMDIQMPIMDGYQATAAIRSSERSSDLRIPIIAMTAHAMRGDRERCLEAGMDAYVVKPIDVEQLIRAVERIGKRGDASSAEAAPNDADSSHDADVPIVDVQAALTRLAGDMDLFQDFIAFFDEDAGQLVNGIEAAIESRDDSSLQRHAHSLKGLVANFGAERCENLAASLEQMGKTNQVVLARAKFVKLRYAVGELSVALEEYRP